MSYIEKLARIKTKLNEYFENDTHKLRFVQLPILHYTMSCEEESEAIRITVPVVKFGQIQQLSMIFEDELEGPWETNLKSMLDRFYQHPAPLVGSFEVSPNMTYGAELESMLTRISEYFITEEKIALDFGLNIAEQTSDDFFNVYLEVIDSWGNHTLVHEEVLAIPVKNSDAYFKSIDATLIQTIQEEITAQVNAGNVFSWMEENKEEVEENVGSAEED